MERLVSLLRATKERDSTPGAALAGELLADGRYQLTKRIGRGGMGSVWEASDRTLDRIVAIKLMGGIDADDNAARQRFEDEARVVAKLSSSYVVQVFDYGVADGVPFIVMERLVGEDLRELLHRQRRLSVEAVEKIAIEMGRALAVVHAAGIVHGDLKPSNLFMAVHDGTETVKLIDFGIATVVDMAPETPRAATLGTPFYMSPEQMRCDRKPDHRSDLWSLGAILYRALTAERPFDGHFDDFSSRMLREPPRPIAAVVPHFGKAFDAFFEKALAPKCEDRFQNASEFVEAFRVCAENAISAAPKTIPKAKDVEPLSSKAPRHLPWRSVASLAPREATDADESLSSEDARATPILDAGMRPRSEPPTSPVAAETLQRLSVRAAAGIRATGLRLRAPSLALSRAASGLSSTSGKSLALEPFEVETNSLHAMSTAARAHTGRRATMSSTARPGVVVTVVALVVVGLGLFVTHSTDGSPQGSHRSTIALEEREPATPAQTSAPVEDIAAPQAEPVATSAPLAESDTAALAALEKLRQGIGPCVENTLHTLPGTSPLVPADATELRNGPYAAVKRDWIATVFVCTGFQIESTMPFAIQWQSDPQLGRATAIAWVGFNADGVPERAYAFTVTMNARTAVVGDIEPTDAKRPMIQTADRRFVAPRSGAPPKR